MQNKKDEIITKDTEATVSANEGSVKDQGKEKQMSTEEFKEKYMKQIPLEELPADFRSKFEFVTQELKDLKEEAGTKRKDFLTKSDLLNKKLSLLVKEGKLSLDQNEFKKTQEVVKNYDNLLNNLITEVENELRFTQGLISGDHPKHVDVLKWESDDVSVFLDTKLKWLKK